MLTPNTITISKLDNGFHLQITREDDVQPTGPVDAQGNQQQGLRLRHACAEGRQGVLAQVKEWLDSHSAIETKLAGVSSISDR